VAIGQPAKHHFLKLIRPPLKMWHTCQWHMMSVQ